MTATQEFTLVEGLNRTLTSDQYHGIRGVYSSTQLKDAYKDIEYFHAVHVARTIPKKDKIPAFDVGTYFHTSILEPDKLSVECAVFTGIRRGKAWDDFQAANAGKAIITESEHVDAQNLVNAVKKSPVAMGRLSRGEPEVSGFLKVRVVGSDVYAVTWGMRLGKYGWETAKVPAKGTDIWLKVRADLLADSFILDLKSTINNAKDKQEMRKEVENYNYDLSAALYLDVFSAIEQKVKTDFVWTFASKKFINCRSYMASAKTIQIGRHKWKTGVLQIAEGIESNWAFDDFMGEISPSSWELEIIKEREEALL